MSSISIIIPNYNGAELLKKNLTAVIKLVRQNSLIKEVIVVDDGSTDRSVVLIKNMFSKDVKLIQNNFNTGFPQAVNTGVAAASTDFVILLNTDTEPDSLSLKNLSPYLKMENLFAVGFLDKSLENGTTVSRGRGVGVFKNGFLLHKKGDIDKKDTLWASSGSSLYNRKIWQKLGGLDPLYSPFYWEDLDISYRALKRGYQVLFAKNLSVIHFHSLGSIKTQFTEKEVTAIALRNQLIFVWKNILDTRLFLNHLYHLPLHLLLTVGKGDFSFLWAFFQALPKVGQILKKRAIEYRDCKLKDTEILARFSKEFAS